MIRRTLKGDPSIDVFDDTWGSLTDMVRDSKSTSGPEWFGARKDELVSMMTKGDPETVKEARAKFGEFIDALMPEQVDMIQDRDRSVVGSAPCVPALLAGRPDSMWRDTWEEGPGLCRIYVQGNCHANVEASMMLDRGIACAALAYAVQTTRPVELYWFVCNAGFGAPRKRGRRSGPPQFGVRQHQLSVIRLPTAPLDLDRAGTVFSRVGIFRHSMERQGRSFGGHSQLRPEALFDLTPEDVIIPGITARDIPDVKRDPLGWVKTQLETQEQARLSMNERAGY